MNWYVRLLFRTVPVDINDDEALDEVAATLPMPMRPGLYFDSVAGTTGVSLELYASDLPAAMEQTLDATAPLVGVLGPVDSIEILSEQEYLHRLGGPAGVAGDDRLAHQQTP